MTNQHQSAREHLHAEMKLTPEDPDVLVSMGSIFLSIDEPDLATHCLLKAVDIDHSNADAYYYLALASATSGEFDGAAEFFTHALDLHPQDLLSLTDSAAVYLAMGKLSAASERIHQAKLLAPGDPRVTEIYRQILFARARQAISDLFWWLKR
jgi:tetratricopeptide (TPR) repeat protein